MIVHGLFRLIRLRKVNCLLTTFFWVSMFLTWVPHECWAQEKVLQERIERTIAPVKAEVGVSIRGIEDATAVSVNGGKRLPMQSVFKFPIALTILHEVDKGRLSLEQEIDIQKGDLLPDTWSPMRQKHPNGVKISLAELLEYTVAESDNNACDILLKLLGGASKVNDYMHVIGIKDISIRFNEEEMHKDWNVQFANWITPIAAAELLKVFYEEKILSLKSTRFLQDVMVKTKTGANRIKGQLPPGTPVAHKTGTSDTNKEGVTAAVNDIGVVTLPDGHHFAIAVLVSDSRENSETNEKIISDISRAAWDDFLARSHRPDAVRGERLNP